jgi:riboflavin biosynthesis pyrimidine reductase
MVASRNGVVAWRRRDAGDDPVRSILGGDERRDRIADRRLMRFLRCFGDVAVGAQTIREQPTLVLSPQEPGDEPVPELFRFREEHGLPRQPRNIVYSLRGRIPPDHPIVTTAGIEPIVVTTDEGAAELRRRGLRARVATIVEPLPEPAALVRAHARLFAERGVRYLACEGGATVLEALHGARLLDEAFVTTTDVVIDEAMHDGVVHLIDFAAEGAELIAEGTLEPSGAYAFRRWRLSRR